MLCVIVGEITVARLLVWSSMTLHIYSDDYIPIYLRRLYTQSIMYWVYKAGILVVMQVILSVLVGKTTGARLDLNLGHPRPAVQ
jgi:hypothetical protein